jgi:hypothetical protein
MFSKLVPFGSSYLYAIAPAGSRCPETAVSKVPPAHLAALALPGLADRAADAEGAAKAISTAAAATGKMSVLRTVSALGIRV